MGALSGARPGPAAQIGGFGKKDAASIADAVSIPQKS